MTEAESIAADLKADGQPMVLSRTIPGAYTPVTGAMDQLAVRQWTVYGLMSNFSSLQARPSDGVEAGTLVKAGDRIAIIAADQERPVATDTITDAGGTVWSVLGVDTVDPAGVALLYKCHVRR